MGLLMVAQRPLRKPQWRTSVQSLPLNGSPNTFAEPYNKIGRFVTLRAGTTSCNKGGWLVASA